MTRVVAEISMSHDGFVTGPNPDLEHGLGIGGEPLHEWAVQSDDDTDVAVLRESMEASGAVIMGRRLFDVVDGPGGWNDEMGYGAGLAGTPPFFVVTHSVPDQVRLGLDFTFVTDGLPSAIARARAAAGEKHVFVMGGADVIRQALAAGLVDELFLTTVPVLAGGAGALTIVGDAPLREPLALELVWLLESAGELFARYALGPVA